MSRSITSLEFLPDNIAVITLNDPHKGANILSRGVLEALKEHLDAVDQRADVAGLVIRSTKPGNFIAGADLTEFARSLDAPKDEIFAFSRLGQQLFGRLSKCDYVTVAAIDGVCVGGGAELATWCDRRILTRGEKTSFGFPEVKLGIIPGWGGTARLPRIVGLANAIEMITGGESIDASVAYGPRIAGVRRSELAGIVERSLTQAALWEEVKDRLHDSALRLSGGQQQRLCIARALATGPEVLLMDEPASALDPASTSRIEDLIFELKAEYTIVIVTHNMQQAARVSDQTAFFYQGTLVEVGPTTELFTNPKDRQTEDYITGRFG